MPRIVLGLDIGSSVIKATIIESGIRSFQIAGYCQIDAPIPPPKSEPKPDAGTEPDEQATDEPGEAEPVEADKPDGPAVDEELAARIRQLIDDNAIIFDEVVVCPPPEYMVHRLVSLPFTQKKKIDMVLGEELDDLIPFDVDDLHWDYQIMGTEPGISHVLVSMIQPARLRSFLATLAAAGIEPRTIDIAANGLIRAASLALPDGEPVAVIDLGAAHTQVVLTDGTRIHAIRPIPIAGRDVDRSIAAALGVPVEEAERIKREGRSSSDAESSRPTGVAEAIGAALDPLLSAIRQALHAAESASGFSPTRILICGGTANLRGIGRYLSDALDLPVVRMAPLDAAEVPRKISAGAEQQLSMAVSLGLALRAFVDKKDAKINLCKGEFVPKQGTIQIRTIARRVAVMAGILLLLFGVKAFLGYRTYAGQAERFDEQIAAIHQKAFPGQPAIDPIMQFQQNIDVINEKIRLLGGLGDANLTALGILREISSKIPRTVKLDVNRIEIGPDVVRLEGTTDDYDAVDRIERELGKCEGFLTVKKDQAVKVGGDKIKFKFIVGLTETRNTPGMLPGGLK